MQKTGKRQFVLKKAYEISYAVFRVGSRISNVALKEHLERQALALLDAAAVENYAWVTTVARAIEYLVKFGSDVGLLHESNTESIIAQLQAMDASIAGSEKPASPEPVPLEDIFAGHDALFPENIIPATGRRDLAEVAVESSEIIHEAGERTSIKSGNRQSAIIARIRQSGNCRIKDLQEVLPDCSERTIRYDLQSLVEQNIIERVGVGGPAVFYRLRQNAADGGNLSRVSAL